MYQVSDLEFRFLQAMKKAGIDTLAMQTISNSKKDALREKVAGFLLTLRIKQASELLRQQKVDFAASRTRVVSKGN